MKDITSKLEWLQTKENRIKKIVKLFYHTVAPKLIYEYFDQETPFISCTASENMVYIFPEGKHISTVFSCKNSNLNAEMLIWTISSTHNRQITTLKRGGIMTIYKGKRISQNKMQKELNTIANEMLYYIQQRFVLEKLQGK